MIGFLGNGTPKTDADYVDLKAAKVIGITVPRTLIALADEVIG
jgi:hypothetical protein